jgi:lipopolysaccharide/colanic/teichoic acid biosynthesis glycosyltransferase
MMHRARTDIALLLGGDILFFYLALLMTLLVRYLEVPDPARIENHIVPFTALFLVWLLVFFIAGLYDRHVAILEKKLPRTIIYAQVVNVVLAALVFFAAPASVIAIAPKTNLAIYLVVSSGLTLLWRLYVFPTLTQRAKSNAVVIASGPEVTELVNEVNQHQRYSFHCAHVIDTAELATDENAQTRVLSVIRETESSIVVADFRDRRIESLLPAFYNMHFLYSHVQCIDVRTLYEEIFGRVALSLISYDWFLENVSTTPRAVYDAFKRVTDLVLGSMLTFLSLPFYPLVFLAMQLDDGGSLFFVHERIGEGNARIKVRKFRSMGEGGTITRVGSFLRKTRIDELPQLIAVVRGDLSLIGPRPELPEYVQMYAEQITYYNARHLIRPGLSGWAQINDSDVPRYFADTEKTQRKLSYDLYYIKHRSIFLDLYIALKTVGTMVSRSGS